MSDMLLDNAGARRVIKTLGLPIPLPQKLKRELGPLKEKPFSEQQIVVGGTGEFIKDVRNLVQEGGSEPAVSLGGSSLDAGVFDASNIATASQLAELYEFFHPAVKALARCGRLIVVSRPERGAKSAEQSAARAALRGFVKSMAKEVGKKGATAHLILVAEGAENRLGGPLRFLLSPRSAFVSGQVFELATTAKDVAQPTWAQSLAGKVAVVTGAARGIGAATARRLSQEGAHVVCVDREDSAEPLAQLARDIGGSMLTLDVTADDAGQRLKERLQEEHGGLDLLVHNAGVTRDRTLKRMTREEWDLALDVNLGAVARLTDAVLEGPLRDGGRIVCVSSVVGIAGNLGQTNYAASKAGLIGYCGSLGSRVAERGITANAVAPGFIETRMSSKIPPFLREVGRRLSALGQGGDPLDVAEVIAFLCTPQSQGLTGSVVRVCGGAFIGA